MMLLRKKLLTWYRKSKREMPWRGTKDPYAIWVSEIMLQQTQVKTVIPYYERWMRAFPNVNSLAEGSEDAVLKLWEGLGYYSRVRNLQKAAKKIVKEHWGHFPKTFEEILALPGIGRYTAGAITSIAFGLPYSVLDGNVMRVLTRLYALSESLALTSTQKKLWNMAEELLSKKDPGDFNQAMMELGATVCTPTKPACPTCPLQKECLAKKMGEPEKYPVKGMKIKSKKIDVAIGIIWDQNNVLIQKRPPTGLWAGMWEFPGGKVEAGETEEEGLSRELMEELGVKVKIRQKRSLILHSYTQFRVTLHPFDCTLEWGTPKNRVATELKWVPVERLSNFAFPAANGKLIPHLIRNPLLHRDSEDFRNPKKGPAKIKIKRREPWTE